MKFISNAVVPGGIGTGLNFVSGGHRDGKKGKWWWVVGVRLFPCSRCMWALGALKGRVG